MNMNLADIDLADCSLLARYLQQIESLTAEIEAGMDAVGSNALSSFEQSVSRQQFLCMSLCCLSGQMSIGKAMLWQGSAVAGSAPMVDPVLAERIRLATETLQELNQQYAALIRHSKETTRLFVGLCRSYTGHFQQPRTVGISGLGWSCET